MTPSFCQSVNHLAQGGEYASVEPFVSDFLPDVLYRISFRTVGRWRDETSILWEA
jgi:hypothetical protein